MYKQHIERLVAVRQTLEDANTLAGKSGLITFLQSEEKKYSIVSKCSSQQAS